MEGALEGDLKVDFMGDLEVDLEGDSKGDFRGASNRPWKGTCCQAQFTLKLKFNSFELNSQAGRLVYVLFWASKGQIHVLFCQDF